MQKTDVSKVQTHQTPSSAHHPFGQRRSRRLCDVVNHVQPQGRHWGLIEFFSGKMGMYQKPV